MQRKSILILSKNEKIKSNLLETGYFKDIKISDSFSPELLSEADILIADDKTMSYNQYIHNFQLYFQKIKSNYFITSSTDTYTIIYKKLSSYGIIVLPPQLTEMQISQKICSATIDRFSLKGNAICFLGAGEGTGVDMISQSIAQELSDITGKATSLLILSGGEGTSYINSGSDTQGLTDIKDRLKNNILSAEELKNICIKNRNFFILPGEKDISKVRHYHPEDIEKLIDLSFQAFDVVFINCGSAVTGMSIGSLNSASFKYLITTQSDRYFKNFKSIEKQIFSHLGIGAGDFSLIVNKYIDSDELLNEIDIAKNYGTSLAGVVPLLDYVVSLAAERDRKTLSSYSKHYKDSINNIAHSIAGDLKIEIINTEKKHSFFKNLGSKLFGR